MVRWILLLPLLGWVWLAQAEPLSWQLTRGDATVTLFGSVHAGAADFYPLPTPIERAYASSSRLLVELDITRLDVSAYNRLIAELGFFGESTGEEAALAAFHQSRGWQSFKSLCQRKPALCGPHQERMKPWLLSLLLANRMVAESRFSAALGVDSYFLNRRGQREVVELESLGQQIKVFAGLSAEDQEVLFSQSVQDYADGDAALARLMNSWVAGDAADLSAQALAPLQQNPAVFDALFVERNRAMARKIGLASEAGGAIFVVVGAGHLLGQQGLVQLLSHMGFSVRQLTGEECVEPAC
ncbi:TraB/GumN family protein [Simiduia agarivorans]|uniref:GumN family protein n=1 Tax=Simiduia agarivorans (strain DSM 21679 / JCM 13881 / BCRC 17597 / SA1) TaxID=1117647 RepID=K4KES5_SIMAS|nr:TraB/GumN family protein [Simiduia agarivorans]AFU97564.2 GumN family protein [Simiduia agarivorans SA1 = DSM 21679]